MKVFVDANIILDIFDSKREFHNYSLLTYKYLLQKRCKIYTSCDLITTIYYFISKKDKKQALKNIKDINAVLNIIEFSNKEIEEVCNLMIEDEDYKDLEDTLQYVLAKRKECDFIISNDKNFVSKTLQLFSSKQFCEKFLNENN